MASPKWGSTYPITAHYSFIDLKKTKGWVGLVGWPCSERFTHISGHPSAAVQALGQGKFASHRPTFDRCATQPTMVCRKHKTRSKRYAFLHLTVQTCDTNPSHLRYLCNAPSSALEQCRPYAIPGAQKMFDTPEVQTNDTSDAKSRKISFPRFHRPLPLTCCWNRQVWSLEKNT